VTARTTRVFHFASAPFLATTVVASRSVHPNGRFYFPPFMGIVGRLLKSPAAPIPASPPAATRLPIRRSYPARPGFAERDARYRMGRAEKSRRSASGLDDPDRRRVLVGSAARGWIRVRSVRGKRRAVRERLRVLLARLPRRGVPLRPDEFSVPRRHRLLRGAALRSRSLRGRLPRRRRGLRNGQRLLLRRLRSGRLWSAPMQSAGGALHANE
jgi:hypothetical protein